VSACDAEARVERGNAGSGMGNPQRALDVLNDVDAPSADMQRGLSLALLGRDDEAIAMLERSLQRSFGTGFLSFAGAATGCAPCAFRSSTGWTLKR